MAYETAQTPEELAAEILAETATPPKPRRSRTSIRPGVQPNIPSLPPVGGGAASGPAAAPPVAVKTLPATPEELADQILAETRQLATAPAKPIGRLPFANPEVHTAFDGFINEAKGSGYDVRVVSGDRDFAAQKRIWDKPDNVPTANPKVRKQKGGKGNPVAMPGTSKHNKGLAGDIEVYYQGRKLKYSEFQPVVALARKYGLHQLQGDPPHFNYRPGRGAATYEQLRAQEEKRLGTRTPSVTATALPATPEELAAEILAESGKPAPRPAAPKGGANVAEMRQYATGARLQGKPAPVGKTGRKPNTAALLSGETYGPVPPGTPSTQDPASESSYNPLLRQRTRPREGWEHAGRALQQVFSPITVKGGDEFLAKLRADQAQGRVPQFQRLNPDDRVADKQVKEISDLQDILAREVVKPRVERSGKIVEGANEPRWEPDFQNAYNGLTVAGVRRELAKRKIKLTKTQQRNLPAALAVELRRPAYEYYRVGSVTLDAAINAASGVFGGLAGRAAVLGRLPAPLQATARAATEGGVGMAIQKPLTHAVQDPNATPQALAMDVVTGLGEGAVGGALLHGAGAAALRGGKAAIQGARNVAGRVRSGATGEAIGEAAMAAERAANPVRARPPVKVRETPTVRPVIDRTDAVRPAKPGQPTNRQFADQPLSVPVRRRGPAAEPAEAVPYKRGDQVKVPGLGKDPEKTWTVLGKDERGNIRLQGANAQETATVVPKVVRPASETVSIDAKPRWEPVVNKDAPATGDPIVQPGETLRNPETGAEMRVQGRNASTGKFEVEVLKPGINQDLEPGVQRSVPASHLKNLERQVESPLSTGTLQGALNAHGKRLVQGRYVLLDGSSVPVSPAGTQSLDGLLPTLDPKSPWVAEGAVAELRGSNGELIWKNNVATPETAPGTATPTTPEGAPLANAGPEGGAIARREAVPPQTAEPAVGEARVTPEGRIQRRNADPPLSLDETDDLVNALAFKRFMDEAGSVDPNATVTTPPEVEEFFAIPEERQTAAMDALDDPSTLRATEELATQRAAQRETELTAAQRDLEANGDTGRGLVRRAVGGDAEWTEPVIAGQGRKTHRYWEIADEFREDPAALERIYNELATPGRLKRTYTTSAGKMSLRDLVMDMKMMPKDAVAAPRRFVSSGKGTGKNVQRSVTLNVDGVDRTATLNAKQAKRFDALDAEMDAANARVKQAQERVRSTTYNTAERGQAQIALTDAKRAAKAKAMQTAAEKREITGLLTAKEQIAAAKKAKTAKPPVEARAMEVLDSAEAKIKARLDARRGRLSSGIDPEDLIDYVALGAIKIAKGTVKFSAWGKAMIADLGEEIRPHLKDLWERSRAYHDNQLDNDLPRLATAEAPTPRPRTSGAEAPPRTPPGDEPPVLTPPGEGGRGGQGDEKYIGSINTERWFTPEDSRTDLLDFVERRATDLERQRRGTVTHEQTTAAAQRLGMTVQEARNIRPGKALNDAELVALGDVADQMEQRLLAAARRVTDEGADSTRAMLEYSVAQNEYDAAMLALNGARSEAGRALNALKIAKKSLRTLTIEDLIEPSRAPDPVPAFEPPTVDYNAAPAPTPERATRLPRRNQANAENAQGVLLDVQAPASAPEPTGRTQPLSKVAGLGEAEQVPLPGVDAPQAEGAARAPRAASEGQARTPRKFQRFGETNQIFTKERAAAAIQRIKEKLGSIGSKVRAGADPLTTAAQVGYEAVKEILPELIELGGYIREGGIRTFPAWARTLREAIGEEAQGLADSTLREIWNAIRPEAEKRLRQKNQQDLVLKKVLAELGGRDELLKNAEALRAATDGNDPFAVAKWFQERQKMTFREAFNRFHKGNLLMNPLAIWRNINSTTANLQVRPVTNVLSHLLDIPIAALEKRPPVGNLKATGVGVVASIKEGVPNGLRAWKDVIQHGMTESQAARLDVPRKEFPGGATNPWNMIFRLMNDSLFKEIAYTGEVAERAYAQAAKEGLKGADLERRFLELREDPTLMERAQKVAEYYTYNSRDNKLGELLLQWKRIPWLGPLMDIVIPFSTTPSNDLRVKLHYSPMGALRLFATDEASRLRLREPGAKAEILAQAAIGTAGLVAAASVIGSNDITGAVPSDPGARAAFYDSGRRPYSIRVPIPGTSIWISYANMPWTSLLGTVAAIKENNWRKGKPTSATQFADFVRGFLKSYTDQSFLSGLTALSDFMEDPERNAARFLGQAASGVIPMSALLRTVNNVTDENLRKPAKDKGLAGDVLEQVGASIPGVSQTLPKRINSMGEEAKRNPAGLGALQPYVTGVENDDPVRAELTRLKVFPIPSASKVQTRQGTVTLNGQQQEELARAVGTAIRKTVQRIINTEGYAARSDASKARYLTAAVRAVGSGARAKYLHTHGIHPAGVDPGLEFATP